MFPPVILAARATRRACVLAVTSLVLGTSTLHPQDGAPARAVLVTGASSGIGLRMTEVLSANGFFVYAGARARADLDRLNTMPNVRGVHLDVTVPGDIQAAAALVRAEGRGLYGLVNNAGVIVMGPLIELREADLHFLLDVNLYGPYRITQAFADLLIESRGRILNVSSIAGILSGPFTGAYGMSKHGVEAYTDALAAELERFGVAVAAVEPGNYRSQILASMVKRMRETGYSAEGSRYGSMYDVIRGPLDRSQYDAPDAVAQAALAFLSADTPRRRYMVVPNQAEAAMTIRQALQELVQLNEGHAYSYDRDELVGMLDDALARTRPAEPRPSRPTDVGIHEAALVGDLDAIRRHIAAGTDLNAPDPSGGASPLIIAATFGRTEVATALIAAGADVDRRNNDGSTALLIAALLCRTDIVRLLLDAGADRSIRSNSGSTALDVVSVPFDSIKSVYDYLGTVLGPYGLALDYARIRATRPAIAELLRTP